MPLLPPAICLQRILVFQTSCVLPVLLLDVIAKFDVGFIEYILDVGIGGRAEEFGEEVIKLDSREIAPAVGRPGKRQSANQGIDGVSDGAWMRIA